MKMIISHMPGMNRPAFPVADHLEDPLQFLFDVFVSQHLAAIFGGPNQMVLAGVGAVALRLVESSITDTKITSFLEVF